VGCPFGVEGQLGDQPGGSEPIRWVGYSIIPVLYILDRGVLSSRGPRQEGV
jgi:hypothetical protein